MYYGAGRRRGTGEEADLSVPSGERDKKIQLALSIYTLAAIIAEVILVIVDFHVGDRVGWSIMTGACFVYAYITLKFSIQKHNGYQFKILVLTSER